MSEADLEILRALLEHRILTSGQLSLLLGRSSAVIRRAIRKRLAPEGLVPAMSGSAMEQVAYCLTRKGLALLARMQGLDLGTLPFSAKPAAGPGSMFWQHTRLTNDVWIAFRRACLAGSPVRLMRAVPEWQMAADIRLRRSRRHWERFELSERLSDIREPGRYHFFRPDLGLVLEAGSTPGARVAAYVEADRATESISGPIRAKLEGFWHWFMRRGFEAHEAHAMRVLFVVGNVRTDRRPAAIGQAVLEFCREHEEQHEKWRERSISGLRQASPALSQEILLHRFPPISSFAACFRFCRSEDFADADIALAPIWLTAAGEKVAFFRGQSLPQPSLSLNPIIL